MSTEAIDRELVMFRERAGAPREQLLGCSKIAHERLEFCAVCVPARRDRGSNGAQLELACWRLLALRDAERRTITDEEREELEQIGLAAYLGNPDRTPQTDVRWLLKLIREVLA